MNEIINNESRLLINKDNCFDFIRYYLSFVVVFAHFAILTGMNYRWITTSTEAVRGFFILSGFLVFYSYINKPQLSSYVSKRIKRIFPPYFFIVLLCCMVGVFVTTMSAKDYLTSAHFFKYLIANLSFLNFIEPTLPGVFTDNPITAVNGSLWTMKVELLLYATVPIAFYLIKKYNKLVILISIFLFSFLYVELFGYLYEKTGKGIYIILQRQVGGQLIYFYAGTFILIYFDKFQKYIKYIFPIALILYIFKDYHILLDTLKPFCLASIIIGFAYNFKYLNFLKKYDNVAYGVYLFHYPVIQIVVNYKIHEYNYYLALVLVIIVTLLLCIFSWHFIEKPFLKKKRITK